MKTESVVLLPPEMWRSMEPLLNSAPAGISELQAQLRKAHGVGVFLRLRDGSIHAVRVNWQGAVYFEQHEGGGYVGDATGAPTFTSSDIESWGHYEQVCQPNWRHPFKKVKTWRVRVWSDGRLNGTEKP